MLHQLFHPAVANWFQNALGQPTEVQMKAWKEIKKHQHTLIAAPTGSGKTLAAFLSAIDDLVKQSLNGSLEENTQIVYVSPLKALSNDIHRNLQLPLKGITEELAKENLPDPEIKVMLRTGDTPAAERTAMVKKPPHILVTTPESLYLLLTSVNGRKMLASVHTIIVDEIHALVDDKRGSHLALSIERLEALTAKPLIRIGLSATQKPVELVADFLTGIKKNLAGNNETPTKNNQRSIIDSGHTRHLDLALELPPSPLTAVMSNEVWTEIYDRLEKLIKEHRTTIIFVNTRRMAERLAHHLTERLGEEIITAHHGSMSKDHRFDAEQRLKAGNLRALVATASLELGIDIGSVDLVCQISSPRAISTFLQRVGRSGHSVHGTPKGRIFPLSLDELLECTALLDSVRRGELDKIVFPEKPIDILAQQIVAEVACRDYTTDELYELVTRAYPFRNLSRDEFDEVIKMLSEGFTTRNGRRAAYVHYDMVHERLTGRKGARLTALVSGGAIPDSFDYDVVLEPENIPIGSVNEDFAIDSMEGDVFQLGNNSWRILKIETGKVRVQDAQGQPPTIPFWFGEAPGRTAELSEAVGRLKEEIKNRLSTSSITTPSTLENQQADELSENHSEDISWKKDALNYLENELQLSTSAAHQLTDYLAAGYFAIGAMPSQKTLVLERFFDEAGDMHLVIHSTYGSRLNRAWGLALRKRFCKKFNFELQAAATENAIILSLGSTHSFPLEEVFDYLSPKTVRHTLIQALLDAPMFEVRWRWNASRALAVLRRRAGKKVPPQIQRSQSEDLVSLIFPDSIACFENIQGEREIPDHPLVNQTIHDCLYEAMDIELLEKLLSDIKEGKLELVAKDLREPSPFAAEILNARPYAFLDDAPLEERRTNAVQNRRWLDPAAANDLGRLDLEAIRSVQAEAFPQASSPDELHDALVLFGYLKETEGIQNNWVSFFNELKQLHRAHELRTGEQLIWIATERVPQFKAVFPEEKILLQLSLPPKLAALNPSADDALKEIVRGRLEASGPLLAVSLAQDLNLPLSRIDFALTLLENEGFVFRGHFTPDLDALEWCERRLLARIHRYTLGKLRKEIEPVSVSDFMRFLFSWHHLDENPQPEGPHALEKTLEQLEGFEAQAAAWESDLLPARLHDYDFQWLDGLCLSGKWMWGKFKKTTSAEKENLNGAKGSSPIKTSPISFLNRMNFALWNKNETNGVETALTHPAAQAIAYIKNNGASFFHDIARGTKLLDGQLEDALSELVAKGYLTADSFTGLRALLLPAKYTNNRRRHQVTFSMEQAGRWSLLQPAEQQPDDPIQKRKNLETFARILLKRYGVIFRKLAARENLSPAWWELVNVLRLMEARGEVRGGRFVDGVYGEQYALPEAVTLLRRVRKEAKKGILISLCAADPLNLTGILTPEKRVPAIYSNRLLFVDGVLAGIKEGKEIQLFTENETAEAWRLKNALIQKKISPKLRAYLGKGIG